MREEKTKYYVIKEKDGSRGSFEGHRGQTADGYAGAYRAAGNGKRRESAEALSTNTKMIVFSIS